MLAGPGFGPGRWHLSNQSQHNSLAVKRMTWDKYKGLEAEEIWKGGHLRMLLLPRHYTAIRLPMIGI